MPSRRFIRLTKEELRELQQVEHDKGLSDTVKMRARFVRLSDSDKSVAGIAMMCNTKEVNVLRAFDRWEAEGVQGLKEKPIPGRPGSLGEKEKLFIRQKLSEHAKDWTAKTLAEEVNKKYGHRVNRESMRVCLRRMGYVWKGRRYVPAKSRSGKDN